MTTVHHEAAEQYRHFLKAARLTRMEREDAASLQRKGRTLREIAEHMEVPVQCVEQSLYWDVVRK